MTTRADRRTPRTTRALAAGLLAAAALTTAAAVSPAAGADGADLLGSPTTVSTAGNEPLVVVSPRGTVFVSALQHLYATKDGGRHFTAAPDALVNGTLNRVSDSSIDVDPSGRLYFAVNYPYAGIVAVCTSDDDAATLHCDPATFPGGNDRQWVTAPTATTSYLTTNEGLYHTIFFSSADRGGSYTPRASTDDPLTPNDGPLVWRSQDKLVYQPFVDGATNQTSTVNELSGPLSVHVWDPASTSPLPKAILPTPLQAGSAINDLVITPDGTIYLCSEGVSSTAADGTVTGKDVRLARSTDAGRTWTVLPALPGTSTGTSGFAWVAAGSDGHLGVVYYRTPVGGRADTATGVWDTYWAETSDADAASPHWQTQLIERNVHTGHLCTTAGCLNSDRFAGDFLGADFDAADRPYVAWMRQTATGTEVRFAGPAASRLAGAAGTTTTAGTGAAGSGPATATRGSTPPARRVGTVRGGGSLAATGLPWSLPVAGLALLGLAALARRRSPARHP